MTTTAAAVFDLFGTLVALDDPPEPAAAVADALAARGISVPDDWASAYREPHIDAEEGAEIPLQTHVAAALASRGINVSDTTARQAVIDAFDPVVETRGGAVEVVAASEVGPVGLLSNCAVPELVARTLRRSALDREAFDAVVVSVDCGWRKPDRRAFETVASQLGVETADLVVIGDTPATDGGITDCGGEFIDITETSLHTLHARLTESQPCR